MNEKQIIRAYDYIVHHDKDFDKILKETAKKSCGVVLEPGPGTGLLTRELLQKRNIKSIIPVEISRIFVNKFKQNFPGQKIIKADAVRYRNAQEVDCVAMTLVWHHIEDERKKEFLENIFLQLKEGGKIIIGDVFLLPYRDESDRDKSLRIFHYDRISKIKDDFIKEVEEQTLKEGLTRDGEYKTSEEVLRKLLVEVGFKKIETFEIGDQEPGGYRVVIAEKVSPHKNLNA